MPDQIKNMLIGIFVVAACAIIVFMLMFLHPSVGDQKRMLRVRFANIDKVSIGTRVTFAGKPVGEVVAITELPDVDTERKAVNGFVYVYELTLRVDSSVNVYNTDEVSARTSGLLGEKSVAIIPGAPKQGEELQLVNNDVIYAAESGGVEDAIKQLKLIGDKFTGVMTGIQEAVDTLHKDKFFDRISKTAGNLSDISTALNDPKMWSETLGNMHATSDDVKTIINRVNKGEGSIGQLVSKDDFYLRTTSLLSKADTTLNDVNHYGILFHLDKGWQRLRARRLNLLYSLSTPQEFRNYFNDEIDQVQTSLERVAMVMQQVDGQPAWRSYELLQNTEFTKVYAELLRRLNALEEEVRMYNTQVVESGVKQTEFVY